MTSPNEFDRSAYTMNRLGPHVMVEKVSLLKRAFVTENGRRAKQKGTLMERKVRSQSQPEQKKNNPLDSLRINVGNGTRGQWSARMETSARG